jgi:hypothetical protein
MNASGFRALLALALLAPGWAASANASPATPVELTRVAGLTRIDAPGGRTLRVTNASVVPGQAGADVRGQVRFVDWEEDGVRWFALSEDGGASWSEPRATTTLLRLHDGDVAPGQAMPQPEVNLRAPGGRLFLVQFRTTSHAAWRDALADLGAEVLAFFPDNAHVVRVDPSHLTDVRALAFVQRVEPYHASYRLERALRDGLRGPTVDSQRVHVRVVALEWGTEGKRRIAEAAEALGAKVVANPEHGHIVELSVTPEQLAQVAAHDDVLWIDRWSAPEPDMDLVRQDSGANWLETNFGLCGQGVRGEVMDGGFETTHQDFDGMLLHGAVGVSSHGTATYGIVFGNGNRDGDGNAQGTGHMPRAGACTAQGIAADYNNLTDRFAHTQQLKQSPYFASFQSNSWGDALTTQYTSISQQMDDITWRLDFAILNSQSNAGTQQSRPQAWAKNVISVGGIRHANTLAETDDSWTNGASIGPAADGRIKPDIHYWYDSIFTTTTGNTYTTSFGGTSAATPISAGVTGLMVQMWSDNVWGTNPTGSTVFERQPHASTIKALLINNAKQYAFTGTTSDLTRTHQGWGRPNVQIARQRAANSFIVNESTALTLSQVATYTVTVPAGETELKVTLVYPDPPGTPSATRHRVNDLDLEVSAPGSTLYRGNNGLAAGTVSTPGGTANTVDTVENVFLQNPTAGTWTVRVRASEINQDAYLATPAADAVFALVVTGATAGGSVPDTTPPTATLTAPASGATVSGSVNLSCNASDNVAVTNVEFFVDGVLRGSDASAPYAFAWDSTSVANGSHTLRCDALDAAGNRGASANVGVTVNNTTSPVTVTFTSQGANDGRTWESTETSNVGGGSSATGTGADAIRVGDLTTDRQYRSIVSFDTSSLPDGAVITGATLRLVRGTSSGTNPFTILGTCQVDVRSGFFGTGVGLANADFEAAASASAVGSLSNAATDGASSQAGLNAAGLAAINKTGVTQFKLFFTTDDNDNNAYDYIGYFSGENATVANRPTLVVTYQP